MTEEKPRRVLGLSTHTCALCGRVAAVLSILVLVPFLRRRHERREARRHSRFVIFGH